jgi:hypothetical protein
MYIQLVLFGDGGIRIFEFECGLHEVMLGVIFLIQMTAASARLLLGSTGWFWLMLLIVPVAAFSQKQASRTCPRLLHFDTTYYIYIYYCHIHQHAKYYALHNILYYIGCFFSCIHRHEAYRDKMNKCKKKKKQRNREKRSRLAMNI